MEYTVSKLARISGVSARTLRYYDEIDLLKPKRVNSSGYRIYGQTEVNVLQQILFYRELAFRLEEIKAIIYSDNFDMEEALKDHLAQLRKEKMRLDDLIETVEKSLQASRGEIEMNDQEKFEAFKKEKIAENEKAYGKEIREKYGETVIEQSNEKMDRLTKQEFDDFKAIDKALNEKLAEAVALDQPESDLAQEVCVLHRQWLEVAWPDGYYDKEKHYNLSLMYVQDERFKAYYEKIAPGAAQFLHEALKIYTNNA